MSKSTVVTSTPWEQEGISEETYLRVKAHRQALFEKRLQQERSKADHRSRMASRVNAFPAMV